ncbi:MAG: hypothetical protein EBS84_18115 [Proteobacteria bacterium]|nr:hypothetical protein [Pseudomonadota bacterium]
MAWRTDDFLELLRAKPNAFRLLALIAYRARWRDGYSGDGLARGEARLGRFDVQRELGLTPKEYRLACDALEEGKFVALQRTHHGTVARIVDSRVFSPFAPDEGTPKGTGKGTPRAHEGHTEGHKEEGENRQKEKNQGGFEIPLLLNTEAFREAWATWCQHLREKRKPLAATAAKLQLDKLAAMGESRAIAALQHSTASNYTGVFEPKVNGGSTRPKGSAPDHTKSFFEGTGL